MISLSLAEAPSPPHAVSPPAAQPASRTSPICLKCRFRPNDPDGLRERCRSRVSECEKSIELFIIFPY
jgi:hypothetical protein